MPNNANKTVYKEKEFQTYVLWKSIPAYFRGMKKEQLFSYGFTDPLILKIAKIKNQTDFAKIFHIKDLGTLTDWNNKIEKNKLNNDTLDLVFKEQTSNIGNTLSSQPEKLLEKKLEEQRKLISILKKENSNLKKELLSYQPKRIKKETSAPVPFLPTITQTTPQNNPTFFQKFKNILSEFI